MDPELVAQAQISWEDFSTLMTDIYGHQVENHDIRLEIDTLTKPNSSGPDTISFLQILDQFDGLCKYPVYEFTKIQQLQRTLRGDLGRATQLQANGQLWDDYNALWQHLILIAPTYDTRVSVQPGNTSGSSQ